MAFEDEFSEELNYDLDKMNKFIPLDIAMSKATSKIDPDGQMRSTGPGIDAIARAWEKVAGENASKMTKRVNFKGEEVIVFMNSPIWAQELSFLAGEYRIRLNNELGFECVKKITFR